jgi:hypothetical protein
VCPATHVSRARPHARTQALAAQRERGAADLAPLTQFAYSSLQGELQVGGVFIRVFNQRGRSGANASNATVTAATATAAAAAAGAALAGPLSGGQQQGQAAARAGAAAAAAQAAPAAAVGAGQPADPAGFCKALVRYLYGRLVERCFRGAELRQLSVGEAANVLDVVAALSGARVGCVGACAYACGPFGLASSVHKSVPCAA